MMCLLWWRLRDAYGKWFMLAIAIIVIALNASSVRFVSADNPTVVLQQPCDRSRRVFTDVRGEISNGPIGSNYTQVLQPTYLPNNLHPYRNIVFFFAKLWTTASNTIYVFSSSFFFVFLLFTSPQDSHCEWLIKAKNDSQYITLLFHSLSTECSYDYIFVYDGDSFTSPLLGSFSGKTHPQKVVATSGSVSYFVLHSHTFCFCIYFILVEWERELQRNLINSSILRWYINIYVGVGIWFGI